MNIDDIKKKYGLNNNEPSSNDISSHEADFHQNLANEDRYNAEEFDKAKTRVLKYVTYKKRTENEVRVKFAKDFDKNLLKDVIEELKVNRLYK